VRFNANGGFAILRRATTGHDHQRRIRKNFIIHGIGLARTPLNRK